MRFFCLLLPALALLASPARAADPFDAVTGVAVYGTGWGGDYPALGLGGRARLELAELVGVDVFAEVTDVDLSHIDRAGAERQDLVVGFDLYMPFSIVDRVRVRPMFGFCASFSFVEPQHDLAPRADDIGFGVHAGVGAEVALGGLWSAFVDVQQVAWLGHDRSATRWTGTLDGDIELTTLTQGRVGVQLHLF